VEFAQDLNAVGLCGNSLEINVILFGTDGNKYPMDQLNYDDEFDKNLVTFLEDIGNGFWFFFNKFNTIFL
jgi:hypothetical protein